MIRRRHLNRGALPLWWRLIIRPARPINTAQGVAAETAAQPSDARAANASSCTLPKIADNVPLEQLAGSDLVTVPVTINGAIKQFLLDLGINKPENTPLTQFGNPVAVYDVNSGFGSWVRDTHVRVSSFGIGNATGRHLQFIEAKKGDIERSAPYAGFLTGDFFRQYDVELDFAAKQIAWLTPTKCTDPNQVVFWPHSEVAIIPVGLAHDGRLQMQAMVQGHVINAEIDTSSPRTIMRRDIAELYVGLKPGGPDMIPVSDLEDGMHMQVYVHTFPELTFAGGGVMALNVPVLIQDYSMRPALDREFVVGSRAPPERIPDLVIGMDVLQHLHMYVVPSQGRVYVTSAE
jgi:hypothetical protein